MYWCYYPHRSRDALSPVCKIFNNQGPAVIPKIDKDHHRLLKIAEDRQRSPKIAEDRKDCQRSLKIAKDCQRAQKIG